MLIMLFVLLVGGVQAQDESRILRLGYTEEPDMLVDYPSNTLIGWSMFRLHSQPQWGTDQNQQLVPLLIDELPSYENGGITVTDDNKMVIKFHIADWAVWSDGEPIGADDFVLPYEIANDGVSQILAYRMLGGAAGTVEQGETEKDVVVTFDQPNPDWQYAAIVPLPAHIVRAQYEADLASGIGFEQSAWVRNPTVSNGPFVFAEWVTGSYLRFVKNPNYWKDVWFDEIDVNIYQDVSVLEQLIVSGDLDMTRYILPASRAADLVAQHDNLALKTSFGGIRLELEYNMGPTGSPALKDQRVRTAIGMSIDRDYMVNNIYAGVAEVANSWWAGTPWYNPDTPTLNYDPEGAQALLQEAGWFDEDGDGVVESHGVEGVDDGTPLELHASTYADIQHYQDSLLFIQDALSQVGISVDIDNRPVAEMHGSYTSNGALATGAYDMYLIAWVPGVATVATFDPYNCTDIPSEDNPSGLNGPQVCNEQADELWNVLFTSLDQDERDAAADQIQVLMANDVMTQYLVNILYATTYNERLVWENTDVSDFTPWLTIADWHFED
jgi:peptide/nickel transport system substrate-binding protein